MLIYPAIDLKDGVCVRLMHGDFAQVTHYDQQPAARLTTFAAEGAEWIHVVDLDGAEAGEARQHAAASMVCFGPAAPGARSEHSRASRSAEPDIV